MEISRAVLLYSLLLCPATRALDPFSIVISAGTIAATSVAIALYESVSCRFQECCDAKWIPGNTTGLAISLERKLYGQHLVTQSVVKILHSHLRKADPPKALVLSFHGWTGGGKNYVSKMIAESMFSRGMKSRYVHFFSATLHFPHEWNVEVYKDQLRDWIKSNVSTCGRSLFIFDEVEKMPSSLLDTIKPYLDYHEAVDSVDFRKSIFILLSNAAGEVINRITQQHSENGGVRKKLQLKDFENALTIHSYNEKGGLKGSSLVDRNLVSLFVPFLPLERSHVRMCIRDDILSKGYNVTDGMVDRVMNEMSFYPSSLQLYSNSGCKGVSDKVDLVVGEGDNSM